MFGVPDEKYGEELCAWIMLQGRRRSRRPTRSATSASGQIAHYKIPRYVRFVDEFPMTVTGKMQKFVMREQMAAELGVNEPVTA